MATIDQDNNFENPYWNLIQVLAWVYSETNNVPLDDAIIKKVSDETYKREIQTSSGIEKNVSNNDCVFPVGITWVDKEFDDVLNQVHSNELREKIKQQAGAPNWFDDIENELLQALQEEKVTCCGLENNEGQLQTIITLNWIDLRFWYETPLNFAGPKDYFRAGASKWYGLKFQSKKVRAFWPINYKQKNNIKKNSSYAPRNLIYKLALEKLIELDDPSLGWPRIIELTNSIDLNDDSTSVVGTDEFGEEMSVNVKSFQNAFSKMKASLKDNAKS